MKKSKIKLMYLLIPLFSWVILLYFSVNFIFPALETEKNSFIKYSVFVAIFLTLFLTVIGFFMYFKDTINQINRTMKANKSLFFLIDISKSLTSTPYLDTLLDKITSSATNLLDGEAASILLIEEGNLVFKTATGEVKSSLKNLSFSQEEGIAGWTIKNKESVIINDIKNDKRFNPNIDQRTGFKTRSMICSPLILENNVLGVLQVLNKRSDGGFSPDDKELLEALSGYAATSIVNANYRETQQNYFSHITDILVLAQERCGVPKGHPYNVGNISSMIAREMNLPSDRRKTLYFAALLHDIGILKIRGHLSNEGELEFNKLHPEAGAKLISSITLLKDIEPIILHHHEKVDGTGFPSGLKGEDIPLGARILAVSEAFDLLTNPDNTLMPKSKLDAISELESDPSYDPMVVKALKTVFKDG